MAVTLTCALMWLVRRVAARAICLSFQIGLDPVLLLFPPLLSRLAAILDLSVTTTPIPPLGACYVIIHLVFLRLLHFLRKESARERASALSFVLASSSLAFVFFEFKDRKL